VAADAAAAAAEAAAAATGTHAAGSSVDTLGDDEKIVAATDSSPLHWRYQLLITAAIGQLLAGMARGVGCACARAVRSGGVVCSVSERVVARGVSSVADV
jgi:hypothetical protein